MQINIIETLCIGLAQLQAKRDPLTAALDKIVTDKAPMERAIQAAGNAYSEAAAALADARAGHALNEVGQADLALARDALSAAQKAVTKLELTKPELAGLVAAEQKITRRISAIDDQLADLRTQKVDAEREAAFQDLEAQLAEGIEAYTTAASNAMVLLGQTYQQHIALQVAGRDPHRFSVAIHDSRLGAYADAPLRGSFTEARAAEAARLEALGFPAQPATPRFN